MPHRTRTRSLAAVLAAALVAVTTAALPESRPAAAAPPPLPSELRKVPADAALFAYVDFETVWNSKLGDTLRAAKAKEIETALGKLKTEAGITPDMVKSVVVFLPMLKQPGDFESPVFVVTFSKPYDRAAVVAGLKKNKDSDDEVREIEPGVYGLFNAPPKTPKPPEGAEKGNEAKKDDKAAEPQLTFSLADPKQIMIVGKGSRKYLKDQPPNADGPIAPAIRAAADGMTAAGGINFANLPDEIRGEDIPAEVRPFKALFTSDAAIATAKLSGDAVKLDVRFRSTDKGKVAEAEKALGAGRTLLSLAISAGLAELEKAKGEEEKAVIPLVKAAAEVVRSIKITLESDEAIASATVKTDLPYGPLAQSVFGGGPGRATDASNRARTQNNLKQVGLALHNYHDIHGVFPPAAVLGRKGKKLLSWRVEILPYVEQEALYKQFRLDEPWDSEHNKAVMEKHPMPNVFMLHGVNKEGDKVTYLQAPVGKDTIFDPIQGTRIQSITDGTSNTILAVFGTKAVPWTKPDDLEINPKVDPRTLLNFNETGTSVLFADGSVRFLSKTIAEDVLKAMLTKSGGEVISNDD